MKICFIVDGGRDLGMGHVQQSITLAGYFSKQADVFFLTKSDEAVVSLLLEAGLNVTLCHGDEQIVDRLIDFAPQVVVIDNIDVPENLARKIKNELKCSLAIFTNLSSANRYADIAVTADIGSQFENLVYTDNETNTRYYFGPKYWVLRPEFFGYRNAPQKILSRPLKRILLIFGGSDPSNLTAFSLDALLSAGASYQIDAVLGASFANDNSLKDVLKRHVGWENRVSVYRNIRNVAEKMFTADIVVASPGLSAFEALRVGSPVIVIPHDDLQRDTYRGFMRMIERHEIDKLPRMIELMDFTEPHESHIAAMQIGEGVEELLGAIRDSAGEGQ